MQFPVFLLCTSPVMSLMALVAVKSQGHMHFQLLVYAVHLTGLPFIPCISAAWTSQLQLLSWMAQALSNYKLIQFTHEPFYLHWVNSLLLSCYWTFSSVLSSVMVLLLVVLVLNTFYITAEFWKIRDKRWCFTHYDNALCCGFPCRVITCLTLLKIQSKSWLSCK